MQKTTAMKHLRNILLIIVSFLLSNLSTFSQGVSINSDGTEANSSAMLDIKSTTGGLLMPRMTFVQKNAIGSPATGLLVYQTDNTKGFYYYTGSLWTLLSDSFLKYSNLAQAESASGTDNDLCYVVEIETFFRYESSASEYTDDNKYILSTGDGGDTRWLGVGGKYNVNNILLDEIVHLDATAGSATITDLNKIYYIEAASTATTITIPDATTQNAGWFLRIYKSGGQGAINIQTASSQNIDGSSTAQIVYFGKGFYIKADVNSAPQWLKIQDSRPSLPVVIDITSDYDENENWQFGYMFADTDGGDITFTFPADILSFPEGAIRFIFNTGSNRLFGNPNGNIVDGSSETRLIAPGGYIEFQKISGNVKIIREKNVTIQKNSSDISNLECWLDASQLTGTDGSSISSWTDLKNGTVFSASAGAEPTLQTNEQNGKNVVRFDGNNDVMSAGDTELHNNTRGLTMIAVVKPTDNKRMAILSKYLASPANREFAFGNKDNYLFENLNWSSRTLGHAVMSNNDFHIAEFVWKPGQAFEYYINGVLQTSGNSSVSDISDGNANLKLGGGDYTYVGFWDGDFAEIIVYSDAVSDTERNALRNNLAVKWDIDEIIIANGGSKLWQRDANTNTISPDVQDDNIDIGTGTFTGGTLSVSDLINAPTSSSHPASPQAGSIYFNTSDNKLKVYTGTVWENLN